MCKPKIFANADAHLRMRMRNCAKIERCKVSLRILNNVQARGK